MTVQRRVLRSGAVTWRARVWVRGGTSRRGYVERSKSFAAKREADAWEREQRRAKSRGEWIDPQAGRITLSDWHAMSADALYARLKAKTRATYARQWRLRIEPAFGGVRLVTITSTAIERELARWVEAGASASTIADALGVLSGLLDLACRDNRIVRNPVPTVRRPRPGPRHGYQGLSVPQIERLATECTRLGGLLYGDIVRMLAFTGLRYGELAGLRVRDVDLLRRRIEVRRGVVEVDGLLVDQTPKSHHARTVPIIRQLVPVVERLMSGAGPNDLLVRGMRGKVVRNNTFRKATDWVATVSRMGWPGLRIHDLRATAATIFLDAGVAPGDVQRILGHSSLAVTNLYVRSRDDSVARAAAALDAFVVAETEIDAASGQNPATSDDAAVS